MRKLLSANFSRLWKNKVFWIGMIVMAGFAAIERVLIYTEIRRGNPQTLDVNFYAFTILIGIVLAVFCSLFIGTEYSDGTIRNKITVGHTRISVYLSNLILCSAAGLFMCAAYIVTTLIIGVPLMGFLQAGIMETLLTVICCVVLSVAFSAFFVLISMLCQNKAIVAVISILAAFFLLFMGIHVYSRLNEPEVYSVYEATINGEGQETDTVENPLFLKGAKRQLYEFFYDFLPGCQSLRLSGMMNNPDPSFRLAGYSLLIVVLTTGCGLVFFQRKDLK